MPQATTNADCASYELPSYRTSIRKRFAFVITDMKAATLLVFSSLAMAHPMGNFSVNHYARLEPGAKGLIVTYVLDLAELPTTELIQSWGVERDAPRAVMEAQAAAQARQWAA